MKSKNKLIDNDISSNENHNIEIHTDYGQDVKILMIRLL